MPSVTLKNAVNRISRSMASLAYGKIIGRMPFNSINSIRDSCWDSTFRKDCKFIHKVHPVNCFDYSDSSTDLPEWVSLRFTTNERYIAGISRATVFPRSGAIVSQDDRVLIESMGSLFKVLTYSGFRSEVLRNRWRIGKSPVKVIVSGIGGFYHWFVECLPGILRCLEKFPDYHLLLPSRRPRFVDESLTIAVGETWKSRAIFSDRPLVVEEAVFYSKSMGGQYVHPLDVELLQRHFKSATSCTDQGQRIYISRQKATSRACDESDVIKKFTAYGFSIIELETMSLAQQLAIAGNATHIAGYHGAGFTHGIFSGPNCSFLELFRNDHRNDCYARLFHSIGRQYCLILSDETDASQFPNLEQVLRGYVSSNDK